MPTIIIRVAGNPDLSGFFVLPFQNGTTYNCGAGQFFLMQNVTGPPNGLTIAGRFQIVNVPNYGTVTFSGNFVFNGGNGSGIVNWTNNIRMVDDPWTSTVTNPIPEKKKSMAASDNSTTVQGKQKTTPVPEKKKSQA